MLRPDKVHIVTEGFPSPPVAALITSTGYNSSGTRQWQIRMFWKPAVRPIEYSSCGRSGIVSIIFAISPGIIQPQTQTTSSLESSDMRDLSRKAPDNSLAIIVDSTVVEDRRILGLKFEWISPRVPFTVSNQIKRTVLTSWINCLLVCVPIGLGLHRLHGGSASAFAVNYVAEIQLWFMCDYALEEIEEYIGPTASDLLDIFTTNTVQVISSLLLLFHTNQVALLQTSLVDGILCNILVLLGLSLLIGGLPTHEQRFNRHTAQGHPPSSLSQ